MANTFARVSYPYLFVVACMIHTIKFNQVLHCHLFEIHHFLNQVSLAYKTTHAQEDRFHLIARIISTSARGLSCGSVERQR